MINGSERIEHFDSDEGCVQPASLKGPMMLRILMLVVALVVTFAAGPTPAFAAATSVTATSIRTITHASGTSDPLRSPAAMTISGGSLYVVDSGNNRIVQYTLSTGAFVRQWGARGTNNQNISPAAFSNPQGIGVSHNGRITVADTGNNRVLQYSTSGSYSGQVGSSTGSGNGQFRQPRAIMQSTTSNLMYVLDSGNNRVQYFNPGGNYRGKFGSAGSGPAQLSNSASGLTVGPDGRILVADTGNHRISAFSAAGLPLQQMGSQGSGLSQFNNPADFSVGTEGYALAADSQNNRLVAYDLAGSSPRAIAPIGLLGSSMGMFNNPTGVLYLDDDVIVVADTGNNRIQILQLEYGTDEQEPYVPEPISYDGLSCTDCHLADARREHELKTNKGCKSCHKKKGRSGAVDYSELGKRIADEGLDDMGTCGSESVHCHSVASGQGYHAQDGGRMQSAHWNRTASWEKAPSSYCGGSQGACHSYGSTQSPLWFGSMDVASAHADYWFQQQRGTVGGTPATGSNPAVPGTVDITQFTYGCGLCHQPDFKSANGYEHKKEAKDAGRQFGCPSCHTPRAAAAGGNGSYSSNPTCYRTEHWDSLEEFTDSDGDSAAATAGSIEGDETGVLVQVSTYIGNLIGSVTGAGDSNYTEAELEAVHSSFMGDEVGFSTDAAIDSLPPSAVPASKPASLGSILGNP